MPAAGSSAGLPFVKMEGAGNDYVYIDLETARREGWSRSRLERRAADLARCLADRHLGVGGDGLVLVDPGAPSMAMWNADGSPGELCGNALRCVAFWLHLRGRRPLGTTFEVLSAAGPMRCTVLEREGPQGRVQVELPPPRFAAAEIPFRPGKAAAGGSDRPWVLEVEVAGRKTPARVLSLGNPHLVVFLERAQDVEALDVGAQARALARPELFPNGVNVSFAAPDGEGLFQRTFERGSGETLACGSGACAAAVAAVDAGYATADRELPVRFRGGTLAIRVVHGRAIWMTGPARFVFSGHFVCGGSEGA